MKVPWPNPLGENVTYVLEYSPEGRPPGVKGRWTVPCFTMEVKGLRMVHMRRECAGLVAAEPTPSEPGSRGRLPILPNWGDRQSSLLTG